MNSLNDTTVSTTVTNSLSAAVETILFIMVFFAGMILCAVIYSSIVKRLNKRSYICASCNEVYLRRKIRRYQGNCYCIYCYKKNFNVCDTCNKVVNETLTKFRRKKLCKRCLRWERVKCRDCGKVMGRWEAKSILFWHHCGDCYDLRFRKFREINISRSKVNSSTFNKNPSKRYCGVEIECRNENRDKNCFIRKELKDLKFSQITDGSLNSGGVEFVSRPMNGNLLFNSISKFCKILNTKNYFVDKLCGLHIHLEVPKKLEYLKKVYLFYEKFEPLIFKMVPKSRQSTSFCLKFDRVYYHKGQIVFGINSLHGFKSMIYDTKSKIRIRDTTSSKWNDKRYCWTNFHSVFYRGTLEIRNHSGTTSAEKINNWLNLHLTILDYLNKVDLQTINELKTDKQTFLSLFNSPLKEYVKKRWAKFENNLYAKEEY